MPMIARFVLPLLLCLSAAYPAAAQRPPAARDIADADVDRAIGEAVRFLYAQQGANGHFRHYQYNVPGGGETAIALFALLEAGESHNDPSMVKGLGALVGLKTSNLYVIAVRAMVLAQVASNDKYRKILDEDIKYLTDKAAGAWGYAGPQRDGDNSCSQFALLALWEADRAGISKGINPALIRQVERTWLARQHADGGWDYAGMPGARTPSTLTMATAGLASLYICQDVLTNTCQAYPYQKNADRAWEYLSANLKDDYIANGYLAFCVQRIGMAAGRKFIGPEDAMDWFATGAAKLAEPNPRGRGYGGQWGPVVRASFELIFLARGRLPLTINKLAHGDEAEWNAHTRDVPHFTEYMRRQFERRMRWQIVRITDDTQMMLDAPILLVTGAKDPAFTDAEWEKLREYSLRGGTLLFVPTHHGTPFADAIAARLKGLYADQRAAAGKHYELAAVAGDHPLYTGYVKVPRGDVSFPMRGVSDGTRLLAILSEKDLCCPWQRRGESREADAYAVGVNIFMTATGANKLSTRLRPVFVAGEEGEVRHRVKVARLKHGGNWNTQPHAMEYLSRKLTVENRVAIDVAAAEIDEKDLAGVRLAWMTGSEAFELTDAQVKALRAYLDGGGMLMVNPIGGSKAFGDAAETMLAKVLPDQGALVGPDSPILTGKCGDFRGPPIKQLYRTRAWIKLQPAAPHSPARVYALGDRPAVVLVPFGLHDTLDGHTAHEALSWMPDSARELGANIVLLALSQAR